MAVDEVRLSCSWWIRAALALVLLLSTIVSLRLQLDGLVLAFRLRISFSDIRAFPLPLSIVDGARARDGDFGSTGGVIPSMGGKSFEPLDSAMSSFPLGALFVELYFKNRKATCSVMAYERAS